MQRSTARASGSGRSAVVRWATASILAIAVLAPATPAGAIPLTPYAQPTRVARPTAPEPGVFAQRIPTWQSREWLFEDGADEDAFGTSISLGPDIAVAGAPWAANANPSAGSGLVQVRTWADYSWTLAASLQCPDPGDGFGWSVSADETHVLVGAPNTQGAAVESGAAYAYDRDTWAMRKLSGPGGASGDAFGWFVSVSGDTAVVTAPYADAAGADSGAAYVFVCAGDGTWALQSVLTASDGAVGDHFGWEATINGDTIIVGAPRRDGSALDAGAAYVFVRSGTSWIQQARLTASDAQAGDYFGNSVSLEGDLLAVGANADDDRANAAGAAYVFRRSGSAWTQEAKLTAEDGAAEDYFGASVSTNGTVVAVGAPFSDRWDTDAGAVYIFSKGSGLWAQENAMTPDNAVVYDNFGTAVSLEGGELLVGSPYAVDFSDFTYPGAAYLLGVGWHFTDVHRFYNVRTGTHFYTIDEAEKRTVQSTLADTYAYEGVAYSFTTSKNPRPLHRFYNVRAGTHFYTASEEEKSRVQSQLSAIYVYEGVAYGVADVPTAPAIAVYRFYNIRTGTHFYTANSDERDQVQATLCHIYQYEGEAFYLQL